MNTLDKFLILINQRSILFDDENDPWAILNGKSTINHVFKGAPAFYRLFQKICICVCFISLAISVVSTIYTNLSGDSKALQKSKGNIVQKCLLIAVITGLLSILTLLKDFIDQMFRV